MLHVPVLLEESLDFLLHDLSGAYLDLTFGRGSHSQEILNRISPQGSLHAVDRDQEAVLYGKDKIKDSRFSIYHSNYSEIDSLFPQQQFDGILFDLGTCSTHLDDPMRGFSFQSNGPLDMRMSKKGESAADVVNSISESKLANIIYNYGDERASRRIARAISARRAHKPLIRTSELAQIVRSVLPRAQKGKSDPATRTFQALRIYVNNEIDELCDALLASERILQEGGILAVVSFHSIEDRIVKRFMRERAGLSSQPSRHQPFQSDIKPTFRLSPQRPISPEADEIKINPRARSAKLRIAIRTAAAAKKAFNKHEMVTGRS